MKLNGFAIQALRKARGLSQTDCAQALRMTQAQWSHWERGVTGAPAHQVLLIAHQLRVPHQAILSDATQQDVEELVAAVAEVANLGTVEQDAEAVEVAP